MNKRWLLLAGVFLMILAIVLLPGIKRHCGISEGAYELTEEIAGCVPVIYFDKSDSGIWFTLSADRRISLTRQGTVKLNGQAIAISDDGKEQWIFDVVDYNTIRFVQHGSSELRLGEGMVLPDGAIFRYIES